MKHVISSGVICKVVSTAFQLTKAFSAKNRQTADDPTITLFIIIPCPLVIYNSSLLLLTRKVDRTF